MAEKLSILKRMDAFKAYIPFILKNGINEEILQQIISEHRGIQQDIRKHQERYEASEEGVPILKRPVKSLNLESERIRRIDELINNKLNNTFDSEVVDTKIGYFLGNPINYVVDKENEKFQSLAATIEDFRTRENIPDKDTTLGTRTSIAGYGARLVYWSVENNKPILKVANIDPAECIFLYEESMSAPTFGIQYYPSVEILADGTKSQVTVVEFHDQSETYFFRNDTNGFELYDIQPHNLDSCPLFGVENNESLNGEAIKVLNLVDAYDRTMSDANSEIEATRLAILILRNIGMDDDDVKQMNKLGLLEMFGQDVEAKYLTKDVNDTMIENHLNRLEKNIHKFAKSVDFSDEAFGGNISGIAIKFKTMALEHKAIIAEHKFRSALQYQFKLLCAGWAKLGICSPDDYLNIWFGFKRNLPSNIKEEAEATSLLKGLVSERTRLSLLSFVDDVEAEIEALKEDQVEFGNKLDPLEPIDGPDSELDDDVIDDE
ncbi:phage portal protein [Lysinibacillus sp. SGAir0095]|uniref:phage portal protein n=1 Tax=Lysinibacillus sp. SGAir0095 TaxID=2070463 RepID=UPI001F10E404|nr:phage portal protein [Lysinibacillus sp. SGAir0095]